jgi:hypothetical protein
MLGYNDEEDVSYWTRGSVTGEWQLTDRDINRMFEEHVIDGDYQSKESLYDGSAMQLHMTSPLAMEYNWKYRYSQVYKMRTIPWDTNLLNAFHNLHFICYMADQVPDFSEEIHDGNHPAYKIGLPGKPLWIFELIMKAATECLRDDYVNHYNRDSVHTDSIAPLQSHIDDSVGLGLHLRGDSLINIFVDFQPTIKDDGTFGCKYSVQLSSETWQGRKVPIYGKKASKHPLRQNMLAMASYLKKELKRFSKMLDKAEFNQPEYALKLLNGKEIG